MESRNSIMKKDRVGREGPTGERCEECRSAKAAVPLATIDGTTLWWCVRGDCSASTWQAPATDAERGVETPAPENVLDRLLAIAARRDDPDVLAAAHGVRDFYAAADRSVPEVDWMAYEHCLAD
jgi:hypothetical protein